jgi:quinol monooxygenase YgiN
MAVRLIVKINAAPGKGTELGKLYKARCEDIMKEPGCEQFEVFQSVVHADNLVILERWTDAAALDVHSKVNATRAPLPAELRVGTTEREDYVYNRTR